MCGCFEYMCVYAPLAYLVHTEAEEGIPSTELELMELLMIVLNHHVCAGNWTQAIYRSKKCLKLLSHFSSTSTTPFNRNKKSSQPENHEWTSSLWRELFVFVCILTAVQCPPPADLLWKWNSVLSKTDGCTVFGSFLQEVDAPWQKSIHFFA